MKVLFFALLGFFLTLLLGGYIVMLVAGMLHHVVDADFPSWGFKQSVAVSLALAVLGTYFRSYDLKG